jgi:hypothetical protein
VQDGVIAIADLLELLDAGQEHPKTWILRTDFFKRPISQAHTFREGNAMIANLNELWELIRHVRSIPGCLTDGG